MTRWKISFTIATNGCLGGTRGRAGRGVVEEELHTGEG